MQEGRQAAPPPAQQLTLASRTLCPSGWETRRTWCHLSDILAPTASPRSNREETTDPPRRRDIPPNETQFLKKCGCHERQSLKEASDGSTGHRRPGQETEGRAGDRVGSGIWGEIAFSGQLARWEVTVWCGIKVALSEFDHCTEDVRECRHS